MTNPIEMATAVHVDGLDQVRIKWTHAAHAAYLIVPPGTGAEIARRLMHGPPSPPLDFKAFAPGTIMVDELPTLRDRFEMAALTGLLAAAGNPYEMTASVYESVISTARSVAEDMLAARTREPAR